MKSVILAGGLGTRISEESHLKPKPMIEIGGKPILWHIMKVYSYYGINDFIICTGYKGYVIKEYFANYFLHQSDITFDTCSNNMKLHNRQSDPWKITVVDTGDKTNTGGRLKRIKPYIEKDETFCLTYGDGVSNVNIKELIDYHYERKVTATVTAVQPPGRYGLLEIKDGMVKDFQEKPKGDGNWINGGFFVFGSKIFDYLDSDMTSLESEPIKLLAQKNELAARKHNDFWLPMDTMRDKIRLEELWESGKAPWKIWKD